MKGVIRKIQTLIRIGTLTSIFFNPWSWIFLLVTYFATYIEAAIDKMARLVRYFSPERLYATEKTIEDVKTTIHKESDILFKKTSEDVTKYAAELYEKLNKERDELAKSNATNVVLTAGLNVWTKNAQDFNNQILHSTQIMLSEATELDKQDAEARRLIYPEFLVIIYEFFTGRHYHYAMAERRIFNKFRDHIKIPLAVAPQRGWFGTLPWKK